MPEIPPVQGFLYVSASDDTDPHNETICQITGRAGTSDVELREYGPMFYVKFGDGESLSVYAYELRPWFPI